MVYKSPLLVAVDSFLFLRAVTVSFFLSAPWVSLASMPTLSLRSIVLALGLVLLHSRS